MKISTLAFLLLVIFCNSTLGQALTVNKVIGITGLKSPNILGEFVIVEQAEKIQLQELGVISVKSEASNISVEVSDVLRNEVPVVQIDKNTYLIHHKGKVWIEVLCVDFEKNIFVKEKKTLDLSSNPDNPPIPPIPPIPPEPSPSIPEDKFNNVAIRVNEWSKSLNNKVEVSKAFLKARDFLSSNPGATINDATKVLADNLLAVPNYKDYIEFNKKFNEDLKSRWPLSKKDLAEYWKCVAVGLDPIYRVFGDE